MNDSNEAEATTRQRGRPRKQPPTFRFSPYVYNTPLGCQYTQPTVLNMNFSRLPSTNPLKYSNISYSEMQNAQSPIKNSITTVKRERRLAAIKVVSHKRRKRHSSDESFSTSSESDQESLPEEDPYEKLLDYDENNDKYLVKLRHKSYIHCAWIPADEIKSTRVGAMKIKRYKHIGHDEDYTKVDRILYETYEDNESIVLVKWKKLPHEFSTFEPMAIVNNCENFEEELRAYRDRKKMRHMRMSLDWRPSRENQIKFTESKIYRNRNTLRSYQLEGLNWLLNRWYFKQSCIMADEMGLGKTVQSVTFVNSLFTEFEYTAPVLIVAPLSTLIHWEREFKNWTDLRVLTYHGSIAGRDVINTYEFSIKTGNISVRLFDVIITTYEMAMAGSDHLMQFEYGVGIFDEAHRLKNTSSKAATCLRAFSISQKVLLSGTPIQNNLNELWSLFNFIDPLRFNNLNNFLEEFKIEKSEDVQKLQNVLKPLMLRRMKEDVETSIPMKEETIIEVELTMMQKRYYRAILEKNIEFLTKGDKSNAPNLINAMMELRKCCIHPYLLKGAEEKIVADYLKRKRHSEHDEGNTSLTADPGTYSKGKSILGKEPIITDTDEYYKILIQSSGKLVLLDKLLNKLKDGHKVLIFSQMTKCLDLLADYLNYRSYKFERIDGSIRGDMRQAAIDRFSSGDIFVFLLCTRAGGVGINLTAADTVVIFDSDWNPQNDLQAQARCHRIGQKNEVKIYRLITRNSYEREMFDKAGLKLGLDRAILQRMNFAPGNEDADHKQDEDTNMRKEDAIQLLLRKGAYGVLMDTDDASQRFCEEDIDQILERRTRVIKHSEGGNVFSKASFQVDDDIEDPDFWENLLKQKKSEENEGRIKRQCRRLAREGNITDDDRTEIAHLYSCYVEKDTSRFKNDPELILKSKMTKEELNLFRIFVSVLHGSVFDLDIDIFTDTSCDKLSNLKSLLKYCTDLIPSQKLKDDFSVCMEDMLQNYDPNCFTTQSDIYLKFHEKFLFRVQVPLILHSLSKSEDMVVEKARGWSFQDDRSLVDLVLNRGYDNFPYKEKSRDEINQRIRKIISVLSHRKEIRENDNMYFKTIMNFGRITESNELSIEKFLKKDMSKLKDLIDKISSMSKRSRRDTVEADCFDRILFFDKLEDLDEIPNVRRIGMPKRWDVKRDNELRNYLLQEGFIGASEKFGITEDLILKRFDAIFKSSERANDSSTREK